MSHENSKAAVPPIVRRLPAGVREPLRRWWPARYGDPPARAHGVAKAPDDRSYRQRIEQETTVFDGYDDVHALPEIFHYRSNRYLLPMEQQFDAQHPEYFLAEFLFESATGAGRPRSVSLGSGNCDAEIRTAQDLIRRGLAEFSLECMGINPTVLERGRELIRSAGLEGSVVPPQAMMQS